MHQFLFEGNQNKELLSSVVEDSECVSRGV